MTESASTLKTPLHDLHLELQGKMVAFAGYQMPVNYPSGIIKEHLQTRENAGLFDVSHMGQISIQGENIAEQLESLLPVDLVGLKPNHQKYALFLNEQGGVMDDLMAINLGDQFLLVVNAACKHQDLAYLQSTLGEHLDIKLQTDKALIALQGPKAASALQTLVSDTSVDLSMIKFMQTTHVDLHGANCLITRSGYTGEDGFEISVDADAVDSLTRNLLDHKDVSAVGLGARDSLRLEAGLCLYGQDLSPDVSPIEANIGWAISPVRRAGGAREGGFPGANTILQQQQNGCAKKLVALSPEGRAPMRAGTKLLDQDQNIVGQVTSGGFSPSLGKPISMGYVSSKLSENGTVLLAEVRGKHLPLRVATLPFVSHNYYR